MAGRSGVVCRYHFLGFVVADILSKVQETDTTIANNYDSDISISQRAGSQKRIAAA